MIKVDAAGVLSSIARSPFWIDIAAQIEALTAAALPSRGVPTGTSSTGWDQFDRCLAAAYPSPPLFPGPQITTIERGPSRRSSAAAIAARPRAAFSIRTISGIP